MSIEPAPTACEAYPDSMIVRFDPDTPPNPRWIRKRTSRRHRCEHELPVAPEGDEGDLWVCPTCRRRWSLGVKQEPGQPMNPVGYSEGVAIKGPDGSVYWRPFRMRFIGRLQA